MKLVEGGRLTGLVEEQVELAVEQAGQIEGSADIRAAFEALAESVLVEVAQVEVAQVDIALAAAVLMGIASAAVEYTEAALGMLE